MDNEIIHIPVLFEQVLQMLLPQSQGLYIDGTLGAGGHSLGILEASAPDGRILVFDRDIEAIKFVQNRLADYEPRIVFQHASYAEMGRLAPFSGFDQVNGILLDLGLSSRQLADGERGFSFQKEGPLDMRFDQTFGETAADVINHSSESELAEILRNYGEIRDSRRLARLIVANRPFETTKQLAELIEKNTRKRTRIHPATQLFQALRIEVNHELDALQQGLRSAIELLKPGGRLAVISFHSLEDRLVKRYFKDLSRDCHCPPQQPVCTCNKQATIKLITKKAIKAGPEETALNPRSRSARLRVAEKI